MKIIAHPSSLTNIYPQIEGSGKFNGVSSVSVCDHFKLTDVSGVPVNDTALPRRSHNFNTSNNNNNNNNIISIVKPTRCTNVSNLFDF